MRFLRRRRRNERIARITRITKINPPIIPPAMAPALFVFSAAPAVAAAIELEVAVPLPGMIDGLELRKGRVEDGFGVDGVSVGLEVEECVLPPWPVPVPEDAVLLP